MWPMKTTTAVLCAAMVLAGCQREATGQVAAVVNGYEVTLQEVNAEIAGANVPEDADREAVQQAALQRIIERRLMAQVAQDDGIDESQEYLLRERQLKDALLAQMLAQKVERAMPVPSQADIDRYISENAGMFGERTIYNIDRIQFPLPEDYTKLNALRDDHSMEAAANTLDRLNIRYTRQPAQMDALALGPDRLKLVQSLPDGEPFVVSENGVVTVGVITGATKQPISSEDARPLAVRALRNAQLRKTIKERLDAAKATAEIDYQSGFAPSTAEKKAAGTAAPAK